MRKILPVLMALAMTTALMSGCSPQASEKAATSPTADTTVQTSIPETSSTAEQTSTEPTASESNPVPDGGLRIGSLKGPTSMGLVSLMDMADKGEAAGSYQFTMVTSADELLAKMVNNDLDIALVPANMASILYNKLQGSVRVIDINTLGVLYIVSADSGIKQMSDLKGKTIYLTGKGTSPDYVLNYLLAENGLTAQDVTLEYKSEPTEVAALLKEKPDAIGLLPQPFVTVACAQNESLKMVLDLTKEWENIQGTSGGSLVTGVTVVREDLLTKQEDAVRLFMAEHQASAEYANAHVEETAQLVASAGIIEKSPIAAKAIPYCSITYVDGNEMKAMLDGYLGVLFNQDPKTVGGKLPEDDFYFIP